jgi:hypothetical protein
MVLQLTNSLALPLCEKNALLNAATAPRAVSCRSDRQELESAHDE